MSKYPDEEPFTIETKYILKLSKRVMRRLDRAVEAVQSDIENGRFYTGTVDEHMKRVFDRLDSLEG